MTKRFGFTLAEVLITLTIIGVIAAMTVPTLLNNTADQEFKTGFKKAVSTINQAITMQYALEGTDVSDYMTGLAGIITNTDQENMNSVGTATDNPTAAANPIFGPNGLIGALFSQRMQIIDSKVENRRATYGYTEGTAVNAVLYLSDGMVLEIPTLHPDTCYFNGQPRDVYSINNRGGCLFGMIVDVNGDKGRCAIGGEYQGKPKPKDCFTLNVHPDGVRPASDYAKQIMYEGK